MDESMRALDVEAVQAFVLTADLKSFTRAAEAMDTTQSAISLKIKRLEDTLGRRLLERTTRLVRLSDDSKAFLAPAAGSNKQATLTIQSALTFNSDATYTYTFKAKKNKAKADKVIANGVTINGAILNLVGQTQGSLKQGLRLTLISDTSGNPISGTFSNLPDGGIVTINGNNFQASYEGGDGNDLTLTVVP